MPRKAYPQYIGLPCPKHCGGQITYTGNYRCEYFDISCDWEMSATALGNPKGVRDKATLAKIQQTAWWGSRGQGE